MSALARIEARDASASETPLDVLRAVAADLRLCGLVSRETIRRVCRAVTPSAEQQPRLVEQQPVAPIAPGAAGEGERL